MAGRIEAGSYACAAAITGGEVELVGAQSESMEAVLDGLRRAGVVVEEVGGGLLVKADGGLRGVNLSTAPFPGFPTDMQAQFMEIGRASCRESVGQDVKVWGVAGQVKKQKEKRKRRKVQNR